MSDSDSDSDQELLNPPRPHLSKVASDSNSAKTWKRSCWCPLTTFICFMSIYIFATSHSNPSTAFFTTSSTELSEEGPLGSLFAPTPIFDPKDHAQPPVPQKPIILFKKSKTRQPFSLKTPRGDYRKRLLCKILKSTNCQSNFIADVIDLFWVVAPIYSFDNETDWQYFVKHEEFKSCMKSYGLPFITIEAIRRPENRNLIESREPTEYAATVPGNEPYDIQVYYHNMSYIRENLLNVAVKKLDKQAPWEYMAWIDGHQYFLNPYWWEEAIYKTEKYASVQLFDTVNYLNPYNLTQYKDQVSVIHMSLLVDLIDMDKVAFGNAYAISKEKYKAIGFIYDECIATSCDCAFVLGNLPDGVSWTNKDWGAHYYKNFETWVNNTKKVFQGRRAYINGHLQHFYHGGRFPYYELTMAAHRFGFNASTDIKRDQNFSLYIDNKAIAPVLEWIIFEQKKMSAQSNKKVVV